MEREREALASYLITLKHLQHTANISDHQIGPPSRLPEQGAEFDIAEETDSSEETPVVSAPSQSSADPINAAAVENQQILLPCEGHFTDVEISLRKKQASRQLNQLRELIAEKSFQYSHVIQAAPRKGVRTRAQTKVKELDHKIALQAQIYSHCRSCLLALGCDAEMLQLFQPLNKDDLRASTAVLNPNSPGSTNLRLSWLWQKYRIVNGANADADAMWECAYPVLSIIRVKYYH